MRKFLFFLAFFPIFAHSQIYIGEMALRDTTDVIIVKITNKVMATRIAVGVDFGQDHGWTSTDADLGEKPGEKLKFFSPVQVIRFFERHGWVAERWTAEIDIWRIWFRRERENPTP